MRIGCSRNGIDLDIEDLNPTMLYHQVLIFHIVYQPLVLKQLQKKY